MDMEAADNKQACRWLARQFKVYAEAPLKHITKLVYSNPNHITLEERLYMRPIQYWPGWPYPVLNAAAQTAMAQIARIGIKPGTPPTWQCSYDDIPMHETIVTALLAAGVPRRYAEKAPVAAVWLDTIDTALEHHHIPPPDEKKHRNVFHCVAELFMVLANGGKKPTKADETKAKIYSLLEPHIKEHNDAPLKQLATLIPSTVCGTAHAKRIIRELVKEGRLSKTWRNTSLNQQRLLKKIKEHTAHRRA